MLPALPDPEIVIAVCSPIGTDNSKVTSIVARLLRSYGYAVEDIKVTKLMKQIQIPNREIKDKGTLNRYNTRIDYANQIRELYDDPSALAIMCCAAIRSIRRKKKGSSDSYLRSQAYIIDQFKRKEELEAMRQVYGRLFVSISIYSDNNSRLKEFAQKIAEDDHSARPTSEHEGKAAALIKRDEEESGVSYGQRLRDLFPLSDVFVNIDAPDETSTVLNRFFRLYFGANDVSPTRDEYGMYIAKSAALRSLDLSRQVGAAAFSNLGEVISLGCNEVPKPRGGTYWAGDSGDARDYTFGYDPNERVNRNLLSDVVTRLFKGYSGLPQMLEFVTVQLSKKGSALREALVMDLIEFGRIIHAEMSAISDAARLGKALKDATLYCTVFPCHICAKHIVASGIMRVVFIEPYPKSYAERLHGDSICVRAGYGDDNKVHFSPFIGISPFRFRELFERGKRKDADSGEFKEWAEKEPRPIVKYTVASYLQNEVALTSSFNRKTNKLKKEHKIA